MFYPTVNDSFFNDFDSVFNSLVRPKKTRRYSLVNSQVNPKANISQDDSGYQISLAAPGLSRGDFNVEISDNILTISSESSLKDENSLRKEYSYGKFSRSWSLPETTNTEKITAEYQAGILNVNIPVEDVKINKTKKIEVK